MDVEGKSGVVALAVRRMTFGSREGSVCAGREELPGSGEIEGLPSVDWARGWGVLVFACISPVAAANLFVKDEIAHPDQEFSLCEAPFWEVPI